MAFTDFTPGFIQTFDSQIILLAQQKASKLISLINSDLQPSETEYYRTFGTVTSTLDAAKGAATTYSGATNDKRALTLGRITVADLLSRADVIKMGQDPSPVILEAFAAEIGRQIDSKIISALVGTSVAGSGNVVLPAGNKLAVDYGSTGTNTALTMQKIRAIVQKFNEGEVPENDRYAVVTPGALQSLLKDNTVTSSDWNNIKPLVDGSLTNWMGMTWVMSNRLDRTANKDTNIFFQKDGVKAAWGSDGLGVYTVSRDVPGKTTDKELISDVFFGATRLQETHVQTVLTDVTLY